MLHAVRLCGRRSVPSSTAMVLGCELSVPRFSSLLFVVSSEVAGEGCPVRRPRHRCRAIPRGHMWGRRSSLPRPRRAHWSESANRSSSMSLNLASVSWFSSMLAYDLPAMRRSFVVRLSPGLAESVVKFMFNVAFERVTVLGLGLDDVGAGPSVRTTHNINDIACAIQYLGNRFHRRGDGFLAESPVEQEISGDFFNSLTLIIRFSAGQVIVASPLC